MINEETLEYYYHNNDLINEPVSGRIHNIRNKSKIGFIVLRHGIDTLQCVFTKEQLGEDKFKTLCQLPIETFIKLNGKFQKLSEEQKVKSCSYHYLELMIESYDVISKPYHHKTPIVLDDAN